MYFELATGRIVRETDLELSYEICTGCKANKNPMHFNDWANIKCCWTAIFNENEITVEQLIKGDAFVEAVKLYKKQHDCTLREARDTCDKIRNGKE